jgi:hypothetical protein
MEYTWNYAICLCYLVLHHFEAKNRYSTIIKAKITCKLNRLLSSTVSRKQFNFSSILSNAKHATDVI